MPVEFYFLKGARAAQVIDFLERIIPEINRAKNLDFSIERKEVISTSPYRMEFRAATSKRRALAWSLLPFSSLRKRAQRVGIEAVCKQESDGTLLNLVVVPYMEFFDSKEIFLLSQGIFERMTDNALARDVFGEFDRRIRGGFSIDAGYMERKVLEYIGMRGYKINVKDCARDLNLPKDYVKGMLDELKRKGKLIPR